MSHLRENVSLECAGWQGKTVPAFEGRVNGMAAEYRLTLTVEEIAALDTCIRAAIRDMGAMTGLYSGYSDSLYKVS